MVASANLGVLGCLSDAPVLEESADDEREGAKLRAVGRLLSSCGVIVIYKYGGDSKGREHNMLYTDRSPGNMYILQRSRS